jgi:ribosomal protein S18 acetylase RimI-like enzyme
MAVDGDTAARALTGTVERFVQAAGQGWTRRRRGAQATVTGVPIATLNGVWVEDTQADPDVVASLLEGVHEAKVPHCMQLRPSSTPELVKLAEEVGMTRTDDMPLMVLETTDSVGARKDPSGLAIRQLTPAEAALHADLAAAGFEGAAEHFRQLMTPALLNGRGMRAYVGELDGEPVTTGLGATGDGAVGVFNIATPPAFRRRGYGAAVTVRVVEDGLRDGAGWAWLQSSDAGYGVYERLGFRTVETWECWIKAPPSS